MTQEAAAAIYGVSVRAVASWCETGRLAGAECPLAGGPLHVEEWFLTLRYHKWYRQTPLGVSEAAHRMRQACRTLRCLAFYGPLPDMEPKWQAPKTLGYLSPYDTKAKRRAREAKA